MNIQNREESDSVSGSILTPDPSYAYAQLHCTAAAQDYLSNRNVKLQTTYKTQNGDKLRNNKTKPITTKKARNIHFQS